MVLSEPLTYEKIYYSLWETAQRYHNFTQFRVIGNSHDERMIPMLELGEGAAVVFCIAGFDGCEQWMSTCLVQMIQEYCRAFESNWSLDDLFQVRELLEDYRLCFIPVVNPDGFEIHEKGFGAIRNPIYRQMLRMMETEPEEFSYNARGMDLRRNFPTSYYSRERVYQEPASENETRALIRIFQEYKSIGLLSFCRTGKRIVYYRHQQTFAYNQRCSRFGRHLQKRSCYKLEKTISGESDKGPHGYSGLGSPEQFYSEITRQPALMIETPDFGKDYGEQREECLKQDYQEIHTLPLEYLASINL